MHQLHEPLSIDIDDDDQSMYISDALNHRVLQWSFDATIGVVVAGGNGKGAQIDQLNYPTDAILYKQKQSLIICDSNNKRVMKWSRINIIDRQILISFIHCYGLAIDNIENLYVSDYEFHIVKRWKHGEAFGTKVAGGNGGGTNVNQLFDPRFIFVDQNASVYVAEYENGRATKWTQDAKEGIIVAVVRDPAQNYHKPRHIAGVTVDHMGNIYVTDQLNCEIARWPLGAKNASIVAAQYGYEQDNYSVCDLSDIAFDRHGNLYVVDTGNHRVQRFDVDHS